MFLLLWLWWLRLRLRLILKLFLLLDFRFRLSLFLTIDTAGRVSIQPHPSDLPHLNPHPFIFLLFLELLFYLSDRKCTIIVLIAAYCLGVALWRWLRNLCLELFFRSGLSRLILLDRVTIVESIHHLGILLGQFLSRQPAGPRLAISLPFNQVLQLAAVALPL